MTVKSLTADDTLAIPDSPDAPGAERATPRESPFEDLASMVALYELRVFRFLVGTLRDRDLAQTMTQETFLRAWSARESFRGDCAPQTWLIRIAVNLVRDHTRTGRFRFWKKASGSAIDATEVSSSLPNQASSPEATLIARQEVERIWETVAILSERQRMVFLLRFIEELELPAIAVATGMPVSTVKSHLYRALHTVRERYKEGNKR